MKACNECHFSEHCVRLLCKITGIHWLVCLIQRRRKEEEEIPAWSVRFSVLAHCKMLFLNIGQFMHFWFHTDGG